MPLQNIRNNVCFIREQNPVKDLLPFTINYYFLKLEFPPLPFLFFFNSGFRQKRVCIMWNSRKYMPQECHPALGQIA